MRKIPQKIFHAEILNDHGQLKKKNKEMVVIPNVRSVSDTEIYDNYLQVKQDIQEFLLSEL